MTRLRTESASVAQLSALLRSSPARGSIALIASNIGAGILGFVLALVIARGLSVADFGRWTYLLAWASALTMLAEFGVNTLLTREAAQRPESQNQLLITSLLAKLFLIACLAAVASLVNELLHVDANTSAGFAYAILIGALGVLYSSFTALFRARNWMILILVINLTGLAAQVAGSIILINRGGTVLNLMRLLALIDAVQLIVAAAVWLMRASRRAGLVRVSALAILTMLRQTLPFGAASVLGAVQIRSSPILLAMFTSADQVGVFGAAMRFTEAAKLIPNGIFDAIFPWFAAHRDDAELSRMALAAFGRAIHLYAGACTLALILFAGPLIRWTYGARFGFAASTLLWLALALLSTLHNAIAEVYIYAVGEEAFATKLALLSALVQLGSGIPLMIRLGAPGAAIGVYLGALAISIPLHNKARALIEADARNAAVAATIDPE